MPEQPGDHRSAINRSLRTSRHSRATSPNNAAAIESDVQRYRRRKEEHRKARSRPHGTPTDADDFITFARTWAPYGGASSEDIFVKYGMTRTEFVRKLWELIPMGAESDNQTVQQLLDVYPPPEPHTRRVAETGGISKTRIT
ncbi:hypothetical protein SAMN04490220_8688 [Rhodococcus jostii]|uniref:Uncharacterized protein n=2 Tax=Rhodococcus jostii TaxID=132919 RepID=A0A1H5M5V4_RHOJO|nr:hypothetical protein SAMN04490220_8688 [Rhodococcus jostii]